MPVVKAARYDLIREYQKELKNDTDGVNDSTHINTSPTWALAVISLGQPVTYSRNTGKSVGSVVEGAFTRRAKPLIIVDDCISLSINNPKRSHTKSLQATLRASDTNYLNQDVILPGDWIFAWCWNNVEDQAKVIASVLNGGPGNGFDDGLKFVGRVHNIRKRVSVSPGGERDASYSLTAVGFEELDTQFFYDFALATAVAGNKLEFASFMAQLGLDFSKLADAEQQKAGNIKDNVSYLIEALVDMILGKGVADEVNVPSERAIEAQQQTNQSVALATDSLKISPQSNREAPFAYLVPVSVATVLGRDTAQKSKSGVFGYADIMDTIIGVQQFESIEENEFLNNNSGTFSPRLFYPEIDPDSTKSRKRTPINLKGTFLPVNPSFVNRPLFQMLQQYLNSTINEMYTAMRTDENGKVVPTLIVRQIPFSTESAVQSPDMPLTYFLSMPRWAIHPTMVTNLDVGRSNATRINMIHIYGDASTYGSNDTVTEQMVRNPPIYDQVDIQRSGIRARMQTVNCAIEDEKRTDGARVWMEAIADWTMGSQFTLNGTLQSYGIQSPIAEGDNLEFEGVAYHIESVTHICSIAADGTKSFKTALELSNGMPIDQGDRAALQDFPRYPGFTNKKPQADGSLEQEFNFAPTTTTVGDEEILTSQDPGISRESIFGSEE